MSDIDIVITQIKPYKVLYEGKPAEKQLYDTHIMLHIGKNGKGMIYFPLIPFLDGTCRIEKKKAIVCIQK